MVDNFLLLIFYFGQKPLLLDIIKLAKLSNKFKKQKMKNIDRENVIINEEILRLKRVTVPLFTVFILDIFHFYNFENGKRTCSSCDKIHSFRKV